MKLSVVMLTSLVAADDSASEPVKSLHRLSGFSQEILESGAFDHKPVSWRSRWIRKFQFNSNRMERGVNRKCGFYDADIHTFNYEYDTENACNGIKMIMDGFSTWVENHLSGCSGQRNHNYQKKKLQIWTDILTDALNCNTDVSSYTFVIPEEGWYWSAENRNVSMGESFEFSDSCNPDFKDLDERGCEELISYYYSCNFPAQGYFEYAVFNEQGILETFGLQCPQCGCGADGATNLNDVWAELGSMLN